MKKLKPWKVLMSLSFIIVTFLNTNVANAIDFEMAFYHPISAGQKQTVPLYIRNIPARGLGAFGINLYFDPTKVTIANEADIQYSITNDTDFSTRVVGSYLCAANINREEVAGIRKAMFSCVTPFQGVAGDAVAANITFTGVASSKQTTNIIVEANGFSKTMDYSLAPTEPLQPSPYSPPPNQLNVNLMTVPASSTPRNFRIYR
jgi:hypothetical protein